MRLTPQKAKLHYSRSACNFLHVFAKIKVQINAFKRLAKEDDFMFVDIIVGAFAIAFLAMLGLSRKKSFGKCAGCAGAEGGCEPSACAGCASSSSCSTAKK